MKLTTTTLVAALAAMLVSGVAMAQPVEHHTVLTGKIVSVLAVGTPVHAGDTLVTVETLAGPMAASKAIMDGRVTAVDVQSGDMVQRGQVVATVEESK